MLPEQENSNENPQENVDQLLSELTIQRKQLSSDRMDISFGELINLYRNKELIIRPEYQRLFRWTQSQKTALLESILLSIPIPPIFVSEDENGVWELVDGLQRVSTFISFFGELNENVSETFMKDEEDENDEDLEVSLKNKWTLLEGSLIPSLSNFNIDNLPTRIIINLKRATCRVEILRGESQTAMKYELFKRLNSGGSKLTPQEIRNAVYRGINPKLNELILELSKNETFMKLTNLSEKKKSELYDQELVLRFIALLDNADNVNQNTENFLNSFMENSVKNDNFDYSKYQKIFLEALNLINELDDDKVFRNTTTSKTNMFVPAHYEGIMVGVAQNIEKYKSNKSKLSLKIQELKDDPEFARLSGTGSNSKSRLKNRLKRAHIIFND